MPFESVLPPVEIPKGDIWGLLFKSTTRPYPEDQGQHEVPLLHRKGCLLILFERIVIYVDANTHRSYKYRDVRDIAVGFGKGLRTQWNWQKGDVMGVFSTNCIDFPSAVWGCHWAGGVASLANPAYNSEEL